MVKTVVMAATVALVSVVGVSASGRALLDHTKAQVAMEKEAVAMVAQVEEVARDVSYHADRLLQLAQTFSVSRWSHYHHLDEIKALVNDGLRPALRKLTDVQAQLPEWKQGAIDQMVADAQRLANDTNSAYLAKSGGGGLPTAMNQEYKQFVTDVAAHAAALTKTADAAHAFAEGHLKAAEAGLKVTS